MKNFRLESIVYIPTAMKTISNVQSYASLGYK